MNPLRWSAAAVASIALLPAGCGGDRATDIETWTVEAELIEASVFPVLEEIRPYREALIGHRYRFLDGSPEEGIIYHWAIREDKPTAVKDLKTGSRIRVRIQRMSDHPELRAAFRKNTIDAFELQVYLAVEE